MSARWRTGSRRTCREFERAGLVQGSRANGLRPALRGKVVAMTTLSLAMIVRNEGATIERALGCARLFADEMIVVDTGSTDETVAKAEAMGAKVRHFRWVDDFAAARNYSFSQCAMDWILWLDGDDVISPRTRTAFSTSKAASWTTCKRSTCAMIYPPFRQWRERIARRDLFAEKNCNGRTRSTSSSMASTAKRRSISTRSRFFTPPRPTGTR